MVVLVVQITNGRVDLRELFEKLEIKGRFMDYVRAYLLKYGFEEGYDYYPYTTIIGKTNQTQKEYLVSLDCAKELCMLAKSYKGRMFRKYFIATEKALQQKTEYIEQINTVECRTVCLSDICSKFKNCYPVDVLLLLFERGILVRRCSGNYPAPYYEEGNDLIPCKGADGRPYVRYTPRGEMIISDLLLENGYKLK